MEALTFWKTVTMDRSDFLEKLIALLAKHQIQYCVIGGRRSTLSLIRLSALIWIWWSLSTNWKW